MISPLEERSIRSLLTSGSSFVETDIRSGKRRKRYVWLSKDLNTIYCSDSKKAWRPTEICKSSDVNDVLEADEFGFYLVTSKKKILLTATDDSQRAEWISSLRSISTLRSPKTSSPFNVQHITHVNANLEWTGNLSEELVLYELLGEGSFGSVYRAIHTRTGTVIAVKIIVAENIIELQGEIEILKKCAHANIVSYYGCWGPDKEGQIWILMDYCNGGDAGELYSLSSSQIPELIIRYLLLCAVRALVYLHTKQIMHRDVKGGNILLSTTGDVKLADFGVSKQLHASSTQSEDGVNQIAGSPLWMAPEVLSGKQTTFNSDVWSLGITAIELAEGTPPRSSMTAYQVMKAIVRDEPPQLSSPHWSKEFHGFIRSCLVKDPLCRSNAIDLLSSNPFLINVSEEKARQSLLAILTKHHKARSKFGSRLGIIASKAYGFRKSLADGVSGKKNVLSVDVKSEDDESSNESYSDSGFDTTIIQSDIIDTATQFPWTQSTQDVVTHDEKKFEDLTPCNQNIELETTSNLQLSLETEDTPLIHNVTVSSSTLSAFPLSLTAIIVCIISSAIALLSWFILQ